MWVRLRLISLIDLLNLVWQRIPVAVSCLCFIALFTIAESRDLSWILFVFVSLLACVEKLAAAANTVAVERDWVRSRPYRPLLHQVVADDLTLNRLLSYQKALMFPDRVSFPQNCLRC